MQKCKQRRTRLCVRAYRKQHTLYKEKTVMATLATRAEWTYKISACACALFLLFDLLTL
jgi:hypothetical protein